MADDRIGERIGRYRVFSLLAVGGNSRVYAAHDPELDRWVALKVVEPRGRVALGTRDERSRANRADVVREARTMARTCHPNLATVFEVGETTDAVYIAMELVSGQTLNAWLSERPRALRDVLTVFADAGRALVAAHAAGIVHGDFKPDNVIVEASGRIRVIDFGLARRREVADSDRRFAGTPRYMAPEQFLGEPVGEESDQFAFCATLYRALYREWAFPGTTIAEIAYSVLHTRARRPRQRPGSRTLLEAVLTGLEADRGARHPSMEALVWVLDGEIGRLGWT